MKKVKKSRMMKSYKSIEEYISHFPKNVQKILQKIRRNIKKIVPKAEEAIRYGIPTIRLKGKNLVHFAAYKNHIGFYPGSSGIKAFKKELVNFEHALGTIRFSLDSVIPYDLLDRIVKFRVKESI